MNIKKIKNATDANMDILKQKMKNAFFAVQIKLEVLHVNNADMILIIMVKKQIILYAKNVFHIIFTIKNIMIFII